MNSSDVLSFVSIIASPLFGFMGVYVTVYYGRRKQAAKEAREEKKDEKHLDLEERREERLKFGEILSSQSELIESLQDQIRLLNEQHKIDAGRIKNLEQRADSYERANAELISINSIYLAHIEHLEKLIPVPPGAPARPWLTK